MTLSRRGTRTGTILAHAGTVEDLMPMLSNWLRYGKPRRWIIVVSACIWKPGRTPEWLLDWLYPSDCVVKFK